MAKEEKYLHICEVCGKEEYLTEKEAYEQGWDYPPYIGTYGVLSPRTCPCCTIDNTAWFDYMKHHSFAQLSEKHRETVRRILGEPDNLIFLKDKKGKKKNGT